MKLDYGKLARVKATFHGKVEKIGRSNVKKVANWRTAYNHGQSFSDRLQVGTKPRAGDSGACADDRASDTRDD